MTTHQRFVGRHLRSRINYLLSVLALLLALFPSTASASSHCQNGQRGARGQCVSQIDRRTTCVWPVRFGVELGAACVRQAAEVQP